MMRNLSGIKDKAISFFKNYGLPDKLFLRFFGSYFTVCALQVITAWLREIDPVDNWQEYIREFSLIGSLFWTAILFLWLSALYRFIPHKLRYIDNAVLAVGAILFAVCLVWMSENFYLGVAAGVVAAIFAVYSVGKMDSDSFNRLPYWSVGTVVFITAAVLVVYVSATSIANHLNFGTSCFDMGIFVQMFHSLKEHFTAVTTCERDELMSHFRIHGSFVFYLLTPIYALFPKGETLLALQAFFSLFGILPLYLLAKRRGFKGFSLLAICSTYLFCGGLLMPCYYSFHENCLLPTLLMWLLYAADCGNVPLFYIMSALTCIVKEDAPLYVICIALYFLFESDGVERKHCFIAIGLSAAYFVGIMHWLNNFGDGEYMTSTRLGILMTDSEGGILGIVKNVLLNPGYFFSRFLSEDTAVFFLETMLPLMFLPFLTKKLYRFVLIIPYVIMNLVIGSGYGYAADIGFQYIYGPVCLLIYLSLRNVEDFKREQRNSLLTAAMVLSVVTAVALASGKLSILNYQLNTRELYQSARECIDSVPEDASVLANTFLLPHAANRDEIYEFDMECFEKDADGNVIGIKDLEKYDFCVFLKTDQKTVTAMPYLLDAGWTVYAESDGIFVVVYASPEYSR